MATYFIIGSRTSDLWSMFYYSAVFAFVLCTLIADGKTWVDKIVGISIVGTIWAMYLVSPFLPRLFYEWMRFAIGVMILLFAIFYFIYICYDRHRKPAA